MQTFPKVGDSVTLAGIFFPLIVQSYDPNTLTANLKGEHPVTGVEVLVPKVCLSEVHTDTVKQLFIGQLARLKSGGPLMTIMDIMPPLPEDPEGAGTMVTCSLFREDGSLMSIENLDARAIHLNAVA